MSHTESPDFDRMAEDRQFLDEARLDRAEIKRLRSALLNIQSLAESGFPIDAAKLATRCRLALGDEQTADQGGENV